MSSRLYEKKTESSNKTKTSRAQHSSSVLPTVRGARPSPLRTNMARDGSMENLVTPGLSAKIGFGAMN